MGGRMRWALLGVGLASGIPVYPLGPGLAAGAMIFVVSHGVIPEARRNEPSDSGRLA